MTCQHERGRKPTSFTSRSPMSLAWTSFLNRSIAVGVGGWGHRGVRVNGLSLRSLSSQETLKVNDDSEKLPEACSWGPAHDARELLLQRVLGAGVDHPILHGGPRKPAGVCSSAYSDAAATHGFASEGLVIWRPEDEAKLALRTPIFRRVLVVHERIPPAYSSWGS